MVAVHKYIRGSTAVEIAERVEAAIRAGDLAAGGALPTVRDGAARIGVSPATLAAAYRRLRERGLVQTGGRRGTRVSANLDVPTRQALAVPSGVRDLSAGNPDPALLPALGPTLRNLAPPRRLYGEALKDPDLIASTRRGLRSDGAPADHLTVVSGALDGLERVLQAHLRPGDRVAVEDPAFSGVLALLQSLGLIPVPVAIDDRGLLPDALDAALSAGASAVIATPRAQNPTGAALDAERVTALRPILARRPEVLVLEDDHAGPVSGASAETLCVGRRRFALVRSFSKALGPDLRVAVVSADEETIARIERRQLIGMRWVSHILQQLVVGLLSEKGMAARLRAAARTYTTRRTALLDALASHGIGAHGRSGLNVWIPVPEEAAVVAALLDAGYAVAAGERFRLRSAPAIRITIATLQPDEARGVATALAGILAPSSRTLRT